MSSHINALWKGSLSHLLNLSRNAHVPLLPSTQVIPLLRLRTSTRPTLNQRSSSTLLYEHSRFTLKVDHAPMSVRVLVLYDPPARGRCRHRIRRGGSSWSPSRNGSWGLRRGAAAPGLRGSQGRGPGLGRGMGLGAAVRSHLRRCGCRCRGRGGRCATRSATTRCGGVVLVQTHWNPC